MGSRPNRPQPLEPPAPFLIPKPFKNRQKQLRKKNIESCSTFLEVAGEFLENFLIVFGGFLASFGKVAKTGFFDGFCRNPYEPDLMGIALYSRGGGCIS